MNAFIENVLTPLFLFMAEWSLRWAILAALPIGWLLLRPPRATRLRYDLCLVTLLAGLALPWLPRWGGIVPNQTSGPIIEQQASVESFIPPQGIEGHAGQPLEPEANRDQDAAATSSPVVELPVGETSPATVVSDWRSFGRRASIAALMTAWLATICLLIVRWFTGVMYLHRLRRAAVAVDATTSQLLRSCQSDLGIQRAVLLATHTEVASPLTFGLWHPTILLPSSWIDLTLELQRGSLLHELAHVKRRDAWLALWLQVVGAVFVFHPCVRWLRTRLECEREMLCDEMALACGVEARAYATMLRDFASRTERLRSVTAALPFGQGPTVKRRIQQIMEEIMAPSRSTSRWIWFGGVVLVTGSVAAGSLRLRAAAETPEVQAPIAQDLPASKPEQPAEPQLVKEPSMPLPGLSPADVQAILQSQPHKEQFMYGGKSFQDWQATMRADLKPEVRMEAFRAISTFGKNGFADQAARAIIEIAATYDQTTHDAADKKVLESAASEIDRLGTAALPALQAELQGGKTNGRRFSARILKSLQAQAKPAAIALERALEDEDPFVRSQAALCLNYFSDRNDPAFLQILVDTIAMGLENRLDITSSGEAIQDLQKKGKLSRPVVPQLTKLLNNQNPQFLHFLVGSIVTAILHIGGDANAMVPVYHFVLANRAIPAFTFSESNMLSALAAFGKDAKSLAPDLITRYQNERIGRTKGHILDTLMAIEAEPKELVPLITDYLRKFPRVSLAGKPFEPAAVPGAKDINKYEEYLKKQGVEVPKGGGTGYGGGGPPKIDG
jgi:beta-lactamase regulating signal transducer with metallopeptidase domain